MMTYSRISIGLKHFVNKIKLEVSKRDTHIKHKNDERYENEGVTFASG